MPAASCNLVHCPGASRTVARNVPSALTKDGADVGAPPHRSGASPAVLPERSCRVQKSPEKYVSHFWKSPEKSFRVLKRTYSHHPDAISEPGRALPRACANRNGGHAEAPATGGLRRRRPAIRNVYSPEVHLVVPCGARPVAPQQRTRPGFQILEIK